ncbi:serine hydrolase domain-containing protein [Bifidobacterium bombi]|uniref:serine hydrolase domain-containing protein n=1 Tax=Bifidobacterium bombi TaxID=471511 RepID=UPI0005C6DC17|nr:serine hydrolase domain-containing protein [Bifidobacterium bombi]
MVNGVNGDDKEVLKLLQEACDREVDREELAGVALLVQQHGQERWYVESGKRSIERDEPMTRDTIFRLYSQTKPITGVATMMLLERGLVDLAQPVSDFLPGFKNQRVSTEYKGFDEAQGAIEKSGFPTVDANNEMTIKNLLTMTSGLPYPDPTCDAGRYAAQVFAEVDRRLHTDNPMGTVELANRLGEGPLRFQPGTQWMYGTSADVLGAVVEVASGMRFGDFLRTQIFEPLGMNDTAFYVPERKLPRLAAVYDNPHDPMERVNADAPLHEIRTDHLGVEYVPLNDPAYQAGGAGLKSTLDDYARFGRMLLNDGEFNGERIMQPATARFMHEPTATPEGYWDKAHGQCYNNLVRVVEHPGMSDMLCHVGEYGWDGWLGTFFSNDPATDSTILLMYQITNAGTTSFTRKVRNIVVSHLLVD